MIDPAGHLWSLESRFWSGDARFYESHLAEDCVMAFQPPVGVLSRKHIVESISSAPRWRGVSFSDQRVLWLTDTAVVLVYAASAERDGESSPYTAIVSSAYRKRGEKWELVFHQQTPAA